MSLRRVTLAAIPSCCVTPADRGVAAAPSDVDAANAAATNAGKTRCRFGTVISRGKFQGRRYLLFRQWHALLPFSQAGRSRARTLWRSLDIGGHAAPARAGAEQFERALCDNSVNDRSSYLR